MYWTVATVVDIVGAEGSLALSLMQSNILSHMAPLKQLSAVLNNKPYTPLWKLGHEPELLMAGPPYLVTKAGMESKPRPVSSQDFSNKSQAKITRTGKRPKSGSSQIHSK